MEQLSFRIAETEGPLDLILQLIRQHKLDIYDIEISKLLEQYMDYIKQWQETDMEIASEFLEMASRLVYIKSVSLLPKHEELEEKLKSELTGQLIEYTLCKQVAQLLRATWQGDSLFVRPMQVLPKGEYEGRHKKSELLDAYLSAIGKRQNIKPSQQVFEPLVAKRMVSVSSRITMILNRLYQQPRSSFLSLFEGQQDRAEIVATFLAVLELVKNKRVTISADGATVTMNDIN
ncbi:MAG: segregation/condensation protein A [Oscillospiraceae bacterium]|nr:segregation/condensation protein A [Oscillospiraceae bacterium]